MRTISRFRIISCLPQLFFFSVQFAYAQDSTKTLNLAECLSIAQNNATAILKGQNAVTSAGAQALEAYGQFLPNLSTAASYQYLGGTEYLASVQPTLVQSQRSMLNYQIQSSLNIFNGFSNYATLKASVLGQKGAELSLSRARQDIALDITQTFLQVYLDKQVRDFTSKNLNVSTNRENELQTLTDIGRTSKSDLYQQRAQTSNDKLLNIDALNKLRNDQILLEEKLKLDMSLHYEFAEPDAELMTIDSVNEDLQSLVDSAWKSRYDLQAARINTDAANWMIKKYQGAYYPQLSLQAGLYSSSSYLYWQYVNNQNYLPAYQKSLVSQLPDQVYAGIGLDLQWNIFTGYYNRQNVTNARINASNLDLDYQDLKLQISAEIRQAWGDYRDALQQLATADTGFEAAQQSYETLNGSYQVGATDFITLINSQAVLLQAEVSKAQALTNVILQQKTIEYYLGQ